MGGECIGGEIKEGRQRMSVIVDIKIWGQYEVIKRDGQNRIKWRHMSLHLLHKNCKLHSLLGFYGYFVVLIIWVIIYSIIINIYLFNFLINSIEDYLQKVIIPYFC